MVIWIRILLIFLISLFLHAEQTSKGEKISLQLLWLDQFEFAGFYIAKEKGFYTDVGLDVDIKPYRDGIDIVKEVSEGRTTYGIANSSILVDRSRGMPIVALGAIFQSSPRAIAVKKSSNIRTINDLKNKKVMLTNDYANDALIMGMLTSKGLKKTDFTLLSQTHDVNDLIEGKADALMVYSSNQPFVLREKGVETILFRPKDYGFDSYADILYTSESEIKNHPTRTKAFYQATMRGWQYAFEHIDESVELILNKYNDQHKSNQALVYEAEELKKLSGLYSQNFGKINPEKLKATESIYHLIGIINNSINMDQFVWKDSGMGTSNIILTQEEKEYLEKKKQITMCVDPDWLPYEGIKNEKYVGIGADYMSHISDVLHIPIVLVPTKSWNESLTFSQQRKCDILPVSMETKERQEHMNFTLPYLSTNVVFATRMDQDFVYDFDEIITKPIGITQADGLIDLLKKDYPGIQLIEVKSVEEGLLKVHSEDLFAFVDTYETMSHAIAEHYPNELKIGGKLDQSRQLRVAVRNDDLVLLNLFDKALISISNEMKNKIKDKWTSVKYEKGIDYNLIIKISLAFLFVLILLVMWNHKLNALNRKIELLSIKDELSGLYNRRCFNIKFMETLNQVIENRQYFFFILLDIDNFKQYNDRYGHIEGDKVISAVGSTLNSLFNRHADIAFRLGGEEFGCFGSSNTEDGAIKKAEEIRTKIEALCIEHQDNIPYGVVTVSAGIVICSSKDHDITQEVIYKNADNALYTAKDQGKNKTVKSQFLVEKS